MDSQSHLEGNALKPDWCDGILNTLGQVIKEGLETRFLKVYTCANN